MGGFEVYILKVDPTELADTFECTRWRERIKD